MIVQPHKKQGQERTPQPKERAIHDLVLLKSLTAKDNPGPEDNNINNAPEEAKALLSHITTDESELSWVYPNERTTTPYPKENHVAQKPTPSQETLTEEEISSLQDTASALLNKIQTIRQDNETPKLNPQEYFWFVFIQS